MDHLHQIAAEQTYKAIGRFMFEFSQVEYTIRYYLAEELGLKDEYFSLVVESYDVGVLTTVAAQVFKKARSGPASERIEKMLNRFRELNNYRNRVAHGLWVPSMEGGTVHHVSRVRLSAWWECRAPVAPIFTAHGYVFSICWRYRRFCARQAPGR